MIIIIGSRGLMNEGLKASKVKKGENFMTANLFNDRFYSLRQPAWHGLGLVSEVEMGAAEAFNSISPYSIDLHPLSIGGLPKKAEVEGMNYRVIVRHPVPDDPTHRVFGVVGPEYQLIEPLEVCEIYDRAIQRPIETVGALGQGELLFLTTKLPDIDIKGDLVENYLLVASPYTGWTGGIGPSAIQVRVTPVRVVCQNTLIAAKSASTEMYKIVHDSKAKENLGLWLNGIYIKALEKSRVLIEAFNLFSGYNPKVAEVKGILEQVYPYPKELVVNAPPEVMVQREKDYQYAHQAADRNRGAVEELFNGKGTGMDIPAANGTGWGLYNAVTEWEDYRGTTNETSRLVNSLFGDRAQKKELAFVVVDQYARA